MNTNPHPPLALSSTGLRCRLAPFAAAVALWWTVAGCGGSTDEAAEAIPEPDCVQDQDCALTEVCSAGSCVPSVGGDDDAGIADDAEVDTTPDPAIVCTSCDGDEACGRSTDLCVQLIDGLICGRDCDEDTTACPNGTTCQEVMDGLPNHGGKRQCLPTVGQCTDCYDPDNDGYGIGDCNVVGEDCAPEEFTVNPGADEVCDGLDNDCDGLIDEGFDLQTDMNHCGACNQPCAPPNAEEATCEEGSCLLLACPPQFGDCDGRVETGCEASLRAFYRDADNDDWGDRLDITQACEPPDGYVIRAGDCNDGDPAISPDARERCDGVDNDCSDTIDDNLTPPPAINTTGVCRGATQVCSPEGVYVEPDYNQLPNHESIEQSCDGLDNDCDGQTDLDCDPCLVPLRFPT
ncbi:MAG: putative metal-binding motif-containing protein, partial [Myxococcota bacterium]